MDPQGTAHLERTRLIRPTPRSTITKAEARTPSPRSETTPAGDLPTDEGLLDETHVVAQINGELVVPHEGRLHFGELQRRARRRGRGAVQAAAERPAYLIVFDVLEAGGTELLARPYRERRAILEDLFAREVLAAPFTLCPATGDRATALDWLDPAWGTVGIEGVVIKGGGQPYLPGRRAWIKVRNRMNCIGCNSS
jgi:ATP-dependent DNA ligase